MLQDRLQYNAEPKKIDITVKKENSYKTVRITTALDRILKDFYEILA